MVAAAAVHRDGGLRDPALRVALLRAIAREFEGDADAIVETADAETALGESRLRGELTRTTTQLEAFAAMVADGSWSAATIEVGPPDVRRTMIPVGPVVVFGASNFPLAFSTPGGDTASALAAGCPVVVKAHPAHPRTALLTAAAIDRAVASTALPRAVFQQIEGGVDVGLALVVHPATAAVGFTGSLTAGRALYDAASRRPAPIPVYAEMSSVNPVFVLPGAIARRGDGLVKELADSVVMGAGQFCTNPGVMVAVRAAGFAERLAGELASRPSATMLTPGISASYRAAVERLLGTSGIDVLTSAVGEGSPACVLVPATRFRDDPGLREEVFGPLTVVVSCDDPDQLVDVAAAFDGQLTSTVYADSDDLGLAARLVARLPDRAGRIVWNGVPTGVAISRAMHHGGPYPAATDSRSTSVGTAAIWRFLRPVAYQGFPDQLLPPELQDANPLCIERRVGGVSTTAPVTRDE
jgi:NADP-dependent aldehyde dehydrogenase